MGTAATNPTADQAIITPATILDVYFAKKVTTKTAEYLAGADADRKQIAQSLQDASLQLVMIKTACAQFAAEKRAQQAGLDTFRRWYSSLQADRDRVAGAIRAKLLARALSGEKTPGKMAVGRVAEIDIELSLIGESMRELGEQLEATDKAGRKAAISELGIQATYFGRLADLVQAIVIEGSAAAIALEGQLIIDPAAGKSGELRKRAAVLTRMHRQQMESFEEWERRQSA